MGRLALETGATYISDDPRYPAQLFHIVSIEPAVVYGKEDAIVHYERWAWDVILEKPVLIKNRCTASAGGLFVREELRGRPLCKFDSERCGIRPKTG